MVKCLPTMPIMWETQAQSLGREDLLEKEMATHSSIPAWKTPWMVEPRRLESMGSQKVGHDWATSLSREALEHQIIDAFELRCWRRLLRVPWTARIYNQSILKEISPGYSLEGLMVKLKFQYLATSCEELTHWKRPWCWETLRAGGEGDDRGWDGWMASATRWTWVWVDSRSWWWAGRPGMLWFMGLQRVGQDWVTELNWSKTSKC